MKQTSWVIVLSAVVLFASLATAQQRATKKILGGYFEEWSIYGANYNVANLQNNGVADRISHLLYAFGNVTNAGFPEAQCHLADPWADYQSPSLPSVNGNPFTESPFGNFGALIQLKQLHPELKVIISLGGASAANTAGFVFAGQHGGR
jgi:chitinase